MAMRGCGILFGGEVQGRKVGPAYRSPFGISGGYTVNLEGTARRPRGARALADFGSSPAPPSTVAEVVHTTVLTLDDVLAGTQGGRRSNRVRHGRSQHQRGAGLGH